MIASTSWIKENMLSSPPKRGMSEAEMRVQRSLQRLEIPEWYLNKHSKAPKILKNDTPIDYRQPSWKQESKSKTMTTKNPLEKFADPTDIYRTNKNLSTSMNESTLSGSYGTPRRFEDSLNANLFSTTYKICEETQPTVENLEPMEVSESSQTAPKQNETFVKYPRANFSLNKSGTFPKISPSRKIENINIVFPPTSKAPPLSLETTWNSDVNSNFNYENSRMSQTFESSFDNNISRDDKFEISRRETKVLPTSCFKTNLANAISPKPFSRKVGTPFMTPKSNFNIRAISTPDGTPQSLFTSALDKQTPSPTQSELEAKPKTGLDHSLNSTSYTTLSSFLSNRATNGSSLEKCNNSGWKQSTYWIGEVKPLGRDCNETCHECGAKPPRIFAAVTKGKPSNFKNLSHDEYLPKKIRKLMNLSDNLSSTSPSSWQGDRKENRPPSPDERFFNSAKKSTELENIVKIQQLQQGKNLVQEIIKELKEKCTINSTTSYASPGTKYFVKRLVSDLQGENSKSHVSEDQQMEQQETDIHSESGSGSDLELNSATSSTSISLSFKNSDFGSECLPVTSTLKSNIGKSHFGKAHSDKKSVRTDSRSDENGVYWIPIQVVNLPKPSSQISVMPKHFVSNGSQNQSPCISPISVLSDINQTDETLYQNFYGTTDSKHQEKMKKLLKIEEGGVLDSGYSDRSSNKSRGIDSSESDRSWYEGSSVCTETESEKSFSLRALKERAFHGKKGGVYM